MTPRVEINESNNQHKSGSFAVWYAPNGQNQLDPSFQVEHSIIDDPTKFEDTNLKKNKIQKKKEDRHNMRLQVRKNNQDQYMESFRSDINIKLKYYGEKQGYEIKLEDDFDETATLSGHHEPHLE